MTYSEFKFVSEYYFSDKPGITRLFSYVYFHCVIKNKDFEQLKEKTFFLSKKNIGIKTWNLFNEILNFMKDEKKAL